MRFPCPVCGELDTIRIGMTSDTQGVAPYTAQFSTLDIAEVECGCDLSADQCEAILDEASQAPFDYEDEYLGEPDY